ncbi:MAG: ATP-binding protein [Lachnospiraceae bacterium]|nr:ATP-binding protein [Lachnospiraceae bacterium]
MFIGREEELKILERRYNSDRFECLIIYGRRRVGKTTLVSEFCKNKKSIFFSAREESKKASLDTFSGVMNTFLSTPNASSYISFEHLFSDIYDRYREERLVVVIDEFPYVAQSDKSIISVIQHMIDHKFEKSKLFFILSGSSMSFMEERVLGYSSPLYGRRTGQMKIEPVDFSESRKYAQGYTMVEQVQLYGILGGIPKYLSFIHSESSVKEIIIETYCNADGYMYEEPLNLLKQELREPSTYNSIIEAVANGYSRLNDISSKIGLEKDKTAKYIKSLIELQIIHKEVPVTENEKSRKTLYVLSDNMFRFWYRFIYKNTREIELGLGEHIYEKRIKPYLNEYLGLVFEGVCLQHIWDLNKKLKLPFLFLKCGRWWGNNPLTKQEEEIDFIAFEQESAMFGEVKWRTEKVGFPVLNALQVKARMFHNFKEKYYVLYSKAGFDDELICYAKKNLNVLLFNLEDLE